MAFDGLVLYTVMKEMQDRLITARVDKIYQPDPETITIALRGRGENLNLLLSADPQYARVHFTGDKFINPPHPPAFCMLLRKYLTSGRVLEISQPGFERILHIIIQNLNEEGELVNYRLVVELMGRHSNLILLDAGGNILDGIRRVPADVSRHREVLPGHPYINPPEQDKANPLMAEESSFKALLPLTPDAKAFQAIMNNYQGISPLIAREIAHRAAIEPDHKLRELNDTALDRLWTAFNQLFLQLKDNDFVPTLVDDKSGKTVAYSCLPLTQYTGEKTQTFATMSELLDYYFTTKVKRQALAQLAGELRKTVGNLLDKDVKKYDKLITQLAEAENSEEYRIKGEMLTANIHQVTKGATIFSTTNYYDPELREISIELDPAASPAVNAQKYFKKYNKLRTSIKYLEVELAKLDTEIAYLRNVELSLEQIETPADIEEIREELIEEGYMRESRKATPNRRKQKSQPMKFKSSDGLELLVGRNNRQNDEVTKKIAAKDDWWFHTKEIPGSHVIIRNPNRLQIPERTLFEAASIAAYFSKARESENVPVDYTQIKNVKKPNGAKPGMVIYDNNQTLYVTPDNELVEKLKIE